MPLIEPRGLCDGRFVAATDCCSFAVVDLCCCADLRLVTATPEDRNVPGYHTVRNDAMGATPEDRNVPGYHVVRNDNVGVFDSQFKLSRACQLW